MFPLLFGGCVSDFQFVLRCFGLLHVYFCRLMMFLSCFSLDWFGSFHVVNKQQVLVASRCFTLVYVLESCFFWFPVVLALFHVFF